MLEETLKGYNAKGLEHYQKFLDLWKDADPGITEIENAKKRLAAMYLWRAVYG